MKIYLNASRVKCETVIDIHGPTLFNLGGAETAVANFSLNKTFNLSYIKKKSQAGKWSF